MLFLLDLLLRIIASRWRCLRFRCLRVVTLQFTPNLTKCIFYTLETIFDSYPLIPPKSLGVFPHFIGILQGIGNALHGNNFIHIAESRFVIDVSDVLALAGGFTLITVQAAQGLARIVTHDDLALADSDIGSDNNINYLIFFLKLSLPYKVGKASP